MANHPYAKYRESMYPHTTNTAAIKHETTVHWIVAQEPPLETLERGRRLPSQTSAGAVDLTERAAELAETHDLPTPEAIIWAQMRDKWGAYTPDGTIRIAHAASTLPGWVLDFIIVHELAHIDTEGHGDEHEQLVARYPQSREAAGYLLAVQDREWNVHRTPTSQRHRRRSPI